MHVLIVANLPEYLDGHYSVCPGPVKRFLPRVLKKPPAPSPSHWRNSRRTEHMNAGADAPDRSHSPTPLPAPTSGLPLAGGVSSCRVNHAQGKGEPRRREPRRVPVETGPGARPSDVPRWMQRGLCPSPWPRPSAKRRDVSTPPLSEAWAGGPRDAAPNPGIAQDWGRWLGAWSTSRGARKRGGALQRDCGPVSAAEAALV